MFFHQLLVGWRNPTPHFNKPFNSCWFLIQPVGGLKGFFCKFRAWPKVEGGGGMSVKVFESGQNKGFFCSLTIRSTNYSKYKYN